MDITFDEKDQEQRATLAIVEKRGYNNNYLMLKCIEIENRVGEDRWKVKEG